MKTCMIAAAAILALTSSAMAGRVDFSNGVYSPEKGVICDSLGKWCADGTGLSASWTEQVFGGDAASKLEGATQDTFGFSNKVTCAIATHSCSGGGSAGKMQAVLFGAPNSSAAAGARVDYGSGVYSPEKGVICDSRGKWCADGTGLSASWTEQLISPEAAHALADVDQSTFGYSNHVKCVVATQTCTGGEGKAAKKMTKMLFGH